MCFRAGPAEVSDKLLVEQYVIRGTKGVVKCPLKSTIPRGYDNDDDNDGIPDDQQNLNMVWEKDGNILTVSLELNQVDINQYNIIYIYK